MQMLRSLFYCSNICELFDSGENTGPNLCKDCVSGQPYCGVSESDIEFTSKFGLQKICKF